MLKGCPIREGFEQWCEPCLRRIHVAPNKYMDNNNPKPDIERIKREVLENLRELAHTPSAHIRTETPDGHAKRHTNSPPAPWHLQQMMHAVLEEAGTPSGQLVALPAGAAVLLRFLQAGASQPMRGRAACGTLGFSGF